MQMPDVNLTREGIMSLIIKVFHSGLLKMSDMLIFFLNLHAFYATILAKAHELPAGHPVPWSSPSYLSATSQGRRWEKKNERNIIS